MSNLESLSRSLYDATGDVKDINQMLIPRQILRDFDASHQRLSEALQNWLGSPDDPKAGWQGSGGTRELFACPYCNAKHGDCTLIPHSSSCPIPPARAALEQAKGLE